MECAEGSMVTKLPHPPDFRYEGRSAHLERERCPLRFVVHAVSLHRHHMDELDVPRPCRADDESRDPARLGPYPNFRNRRGIAFSPGDDELLGNRLPIYKTSHRERIAHSHPIG